MLSPSCEVELFHVDKEFVVLNVAIHDLSVGSVLSRTAKTLCLSLVRLPTHIETVGGG